MKESKVVFFSHTGDLKTGGNNSLLTLIEELKKRGVKCYIFVPEFGEFSLALDQRNVEYAVIPALFWIHGFDPSKRSVRTTALRIRKIMLRTVYLIKYLHRYLSAIKRWQPNVLYTNTTAIFEGAILAWWLGIPHIWHVRELKGIHFKYDFGGSFFSFFLRKAEAQIFVSQALKKALEGYYRPERAFVIYNGISPPASQLFDKKSRDQDKPYTFAMVGRLRVIKNPEIAIRAVTLLKNTHSRIRLVLAGGGAPSYLRSLMELVNQCDVSGFVTFLGEVDNPYQTVYSQSDVYLMCSTNETFGRVTVEAMLAKLPVIGYKSEITGTKEIVEDGVTGLLYEGGVVELATRMEKFILNPVWARNLGEKGHQVAREKFSVEQYVNRIYDIIQKQID